MVMETRNNVQIAASMQESKPQECDDQARRTLLSATSEFWLCIGARRQKASIGGAVSQYKFHSMPDPGYAKQVSLYLESSVVLWPILHVLEKAVRDCLQDRTSP